MTAVSEIEKFHVGTSNPVQYTGSEREEADPNSEEEASPVENGSMQNLDK